MAESPFKGRKVLVTGGSGMVGRYLVAQLLEAGAKILVASLDEGKDLPKGVGFARADLTRFDDCREVCKGRELVFHLAGIKGSPLMAAKKPASFFVPTILLNTNMMEAARQAGAKRYLYTSTIGVYAPAEVFKEDEVWKTFPSDNDRFAGWAKRMGELQAEAYKIEHGWDAVRIVRPANIYGRWDNFDPDNAMVIPSLIRRALGGENPLVVWGDGTPVRDFLHAEDAARGMLLVMAKEPPGPVNLGSGVGVTVKRVVEIITGHMKKTPDVVWDPSRPSGDRVRLMDISRARALGFSPKVSIERGIADAMDWYSKHRGKAPRRYNVFASKAPLNARRGSR